MGDRRLWDLQLEPFAKSHRVIRYDLRGYGETPLPVGPFSYVDDLRELLDRLALDRAALVGNSLGGKVALESTLRHPERVSALVLVDAALGGHVDSPEIEAFNEEEEALLEGGRIDEAVELNLRMWLGPVDAATRERVASMQRRAFELQLEAYGREPELEPLDWLDPPAATRLGEVQAPTLVVAGAEDVPDFLAMADRLAAEISGARKEVIAGAKHLPALERPEEFNRIVLQFLASQPAP